MTLIDEMQEGALALRLLHGDACASSGAHRDRPRIGDSASRREEYVDARPGPIHGLSGLESQPRGAPTARRLRMFVKFLGLLGPQGRAAAGDDRGSVTGGI